jgi:alkylglycerol monooxygenase
MSVYQYTYDNYRLVDLPWNSAWLWIACFFTQDLLYYLGHRATHGVCARSTHD